MQKYIFYFELPTFNVIFATYMINIAFLISAHTDAPHLRRLICSLPKEADFFVHVDAKVDIQPFLDATQGLNVHFISKRTDIMWGSFGQVMYQMNLIHEALSSTKHFDYLISISGLEYPLWKNSRILEEIENNNGKEYLFATCMSDKNQDSTKLYREYRFFNIYAWKYGTLKSKFRVAIRHIVNLLGIKKKLTIPCNGKKFKLYKGGSWWGITNELATYVWYIYSHEKKFVNYFKTAFAPDETFIHTIACNTVFSQNCNIIDNKSTSLEELSPLTYIEYGKEIKVLTEEDFDVLINSNKMFCRKTITGKSDKLLDKIDEYRNS